MSESRYLSVSLPGGGSIAGQAPDVLQVLQGMGLMSSGETSKKVLNSYEERNNKPGYHLDGQNKYHEITSMSDRHIWNAIRVKREIAQAKTDLKGTTLTKHCLKNDPKFKELYNEIQAREATKGS